jgi:hypothetical protein|tara:strand:- start:284 stop:1180 length:897 start_codon:yes stop_codon:yes gene_type:complete
MGFTTGTDRAEGFIVEAALYNQFLGSSGNINLSAPYLASAANQLFYGSGSKVLAKLDKGTAYQYLTVNAAANAVEWAASPASLLNGKGKILSASAANTPVAISAGTNDYILEARASESGGVRWIAGAGGGTSAANPEGLFIAPTGYIQNSYGFSAVANTGYYWNLGSVNNMTVTDYVIKLGSTAGNITMGIYTMSADGATLTRVAVGSSVSCPANSDSAVIGDLDYDMTVGNSYWGAMICSSTPTLASLYNSQGMGHPGFALAAGSYALPSSVTVSSGTFGHSPSGGFFKNGGVFTNT